MRLSTRRWCSPNLATPISCWTRKSSASPQERRFIASLCARRAACRGGVAVLRERAAALRHDAEFWLWLGFFRRLGHRHLHATFVGIGQELHRKLRRWNRMPEEEALHLIGVRVVEE